MCARVCVGAATEREEKNMHTNEKKTDDTNDDYQTAGERQVLLVDERFLQQ